jgi:hypothetical protein
MTAAATAAHHSASLKIPGDDTFMDDAMPLKGRRFVAAV